MLALTRTRSLRVLSKQRHPAVHLTHSDVRWYEQDNDLGRSGEITTKVALKLDNDLWSMHYVVHRGPLEVHRAADCDSRLVHEGGVEDVQYATTVNRKRGSASYIVRK